jgi:VanZ family protein
VTISSSQSGTTVFASGEFVKKFENFRLSNQDLTGRLVVGNSPVTTDDWSGQLRGIAVYDREMTAGEVSHHFVNWTTGTRFSLAQSKGAIAIYPFNEGDGNVAHNLLDPATDLHIPERFFVLHAQFLERPWDEFRPDWNYWKDVGINVGGFIPLGLFFCAYFFLNGKIEHPVAITIALGFAVSLTIEVSQGFLPTRDSGMTDLITNTLGTAIGAVAYSSVIVRKALHAAGFHAENANIGAKAQPVRASSP